MEPWRCSCVVGEVFQSGPKRLSSCLPSLVFSRLHWLTLAFSIDSALFSGWSRFTMTWMPARDSLPSHYVSVHWLLLRDRIFNDRYSGLRVVGMLTFHHLWDLSSGGTHCFPLSTVFLIFFIWIIFLVLSCYCRCLPEWLKEISVILTYGHKGGTEWNWKEKKTTIRSMRVEAG